MSHVFPSGQAPNPLWRPLPNIVTAMTNSNPTLVTTATNNGYLPGMIVRLYFPGNYGMQQLNASLGSNPYPITIVSSNSFTIPVDTSNFNSFGDFTLSQQPQVVPVGETADTLKNAEKNASPPINGGLPI